MFIQIIKTLLEVYRNRGIKFTWIYFVQLVLFDIKNSTNTFMRKEYVTYEDGIHYVGIFTSTLKKIKDHINKLSQNNNFDFVDLGSGKGKPILYLSKSFVKSNFLGIEIDKELHDIAIKNKSIINNQNIKFINDNCLNFKTYLNPNNNLIIYLFNPFGIKTFKSILNQLDDINSNILIIYVDPVYNDLVKEFGYKELISYKGRYNSETFKIFSINISKKEI